MNPLKFRMAMDYLTRIKKVKPDLPEVFPASQAPIPPIREDVKLREAVNRFVTDNPRQQKAGGGMLVQPGFGGTRQGYQGEKRVKGYVKPLSPELQRLFDKTNPGEEWGKGKFADERTRGNWKNDAPRKQKIFEQTRNLVTQEELAKILTEELGEEISGIKVFGRYGRGQKTKFAEVLDNLLFKGTYGSIKGGKNVGGSLRYYKKPSKNDIKKILKSGTLGDVRINQLKPNTVKNILELNKKYADIYKQGKIPDMDIILQQTNMTPGSAGNATARLAQIYNGHKFRNQELDGIRVNKNTASKMFEIMDKSPFGNVYRSALYKVSLATIDEKLGNEAGTFKELKSKAVKALKENKIPVYDIKAKNPFGFNINEIAGVTGSARSKAAEFSQFVDIMEGNLNQRTLANFQSQLSIARQNIENNPNLLRSESKRINKLARNLEGQYDVELPRLRDPDATKYFSPTRLRELNTQGLDIVKAAERAGYTVQMPKGALTAQEFVSGTAKANKQISANLRKLGFKCKFAASSGGVGSCDDPMSYVDDIKRQEDLLKIQTGKAPKAVQTLNTARKLNAARSLFTSTLGPGALAFEAVAALPIAYMGYKGGKTPANILADTTYGLLGKTDQRILLDKAIELGYDTSDIKNVQDFYKKADEFDYQEGRADEFMIPDDAFMYPRMAQKAEEDLLGATKKFLDPFGNIIPEREAGFEQLQKAQEAVLEDQAKLAAERQSKVGGFLQSPITDYVPGLAGGGIAKLAGIDSGPPPVSGPNSQGLQGLMKRVKRI